MRINSRRKLNFYWLILTGLLAILPLVVKSQYIITVMIFIAIFGTLAVGMGLLLEQAGLFSLAHPSWFALGAYVAGILTVRQIAPTWLSVLISSVFVGFVSYIMGIALLRLKGYHLACATFALLLIVTILLGQMGTITGGYDGLAGIPSLSFAGFLFETDTDFYYLGWGLCIACMWYLSNLMDWRIGRAIRASRDSEIASKSLGIVVPKYRMQIFVVTAVMASLAGSLYCFYLHFASPDMFGFSLLIELITIIVIGGGHKLYGPLVGCFVTIWLRELNHMYLGKLLPVMTAEVDALIFGIIIIVILIFMPGGLTGWIEQGLSAASRSFNKEISAWLRITKK